MILKALYTQIKDGDPKAAVGSLKKTIHGAMSVSHVIKVERIRPGRYCGKYLHTLNISAYLMQI